MRYINNDNIKALNISSETCVEWVRRSFSMKYDSQLPPKKSVHPQGIDFFTTMPCLLPCEYDRFGVKVVSRINGRKPALKSELLLYEASTGNLLALMDADWITEMRTGAVAALAIQSLWRKDTKNLAFVGLGSTASATMTCLAATLPRDGKYNIKLLKYKNQAEDFAFRHADERFCFSIVDNPEELLKDTHVLVSAVTEMPYLFCEDTNLYEPGMLLVPIHTRGFQNCDLVFDKVIADDKGHVEHFQNFNAFRQFDEFSNVLLGNAVGRENDTERIIAYNIGLGLHDVYFASQIYKLC